MKEYDFYYSAKQAAFAEENIIDPYSICHIKGQRYTEMVPKGMKPLSKWDDLTLVYTGTGEGLTTRMINAEESAVNLSDNTVGYKILTALFSEDQIKTLEGVYAHWKDAYLDSLTLDPFSYDFTDEEVKEKMQEFLTANNIIHTKFDIEGLYNIVSSNFI